MVFKLSQSPEEEFSGDETIANIIDRAIEREKDAVLFFTGIRKALKADPLVEIPARRTDPVRLLERERRYDAQWFAALAKERDIETILKRVV